MPAWAGVLVGSILGLALIGGVLVWAVRPRKTESRRFAEPQDTVDPMTAAPLANSEDVAGTGHTTL